MSTTKQKKLTQDYADYLAEYEESKALGKALGTFLEWVHKNNCAGVTIAKRGEK